MAIEAEAVTEVVQCVAEGAHLEEVTIHVQSLCVVSNAAHSSHKRWKNERNGTLRPLGKMSGNFMGEKLTPCEQRVLESAFRISKVKVPKEMLIQRKTWNFLLYLPERKLL